MPAEISDADIAAYIDDELDLEMRLAVECHAANDPDAAIHIMEELRARTALRWMGAASLATVPSIEHAAGALEQRLRVAPQRNRIRRHVVRRGVIAGVAAAALLALVLVPRIDAPAGPPAYVADAYMAYRTALLRANMESQLESTLLDSGEILRATRIRVPPLPSGWRVTDAQLFPSDNGPALQIMIRIPDGRTISIFAVRDVGDVPSAPEAIRREAASVAYWRQGDTAYALTGLEAPEAVDRLAKQLARLPEA